MTPTATRPATGWKLDRDEGDARWFIANLALVKVRKKETGGRFSLVDVSGAKGDMPPLHLHRTDDEIFYVLEGEITYYVGRQEPLRAGPGSLLFVPRDVPHTYRAESDAGARWLVIASPGDFEPFVMALSRPAEARTLPPPRQGPPSREEVEAMTALAGEHGIEILGPPGTLPSELSA